MVDLNNAINGMVGLVTIGVVAGTAERIINKRIPRRRRTKRRARTHNKTKHIHRILKI